MGESYCPAKFKCMGILIQFKMAVKSRSPDWADRERFDVVVQTGNGPPPMDW